MSVIQLLYVNRFVSHHICLLCTPTNACAYTLGMAFARADWCLSSYYKFMAVGEANVDQPRVRGEERKPNTEQKGDSREYREAKGFPIFYAVWGDGAAAHSPPESG
ncbi:hypothetical protein G5I_07238 [Acromyrmex echinatior]|uniref:Uncharacterized protein n=1 Tax=Acromyrmex echinatior TaxID=103372 RepID=F4WN88_ACREC|nr:hypothetical protein G5I_07238 [Acromyrmex echinatior]